MMKKDLNKVNTVKRTKKEVENYMPEVDGLGVILIIVGLGLYFYGNNQVGGGIAILLGIIRIVYVANQ